MIRVRDSCLRKIYKKLALTSDMENRTLKLSEIMITIGILIPVVIGYFFHAFAPTQEAEILVRYLVLPGFYIIFYCFLYIFDIDDLVLRSLILINILLVGITTIGIGFAPDISKLNIILQQPFKTPFFFLMSICFIALPSVLTLYFFLLLVKIVPKRT